MLLHKLLPVQVRVHLSEGLPVLTLEKQILHQGVEVRKLLN